MALTSFDCNPGSRGQRGYYYDLENGRVAYFVNRKFVGKESSILRATEVKASLAVKVASP